MTNKPAGAVQRLATNESPQMARASLVALVAAWVAFTLLRLEPSLEGDPGLFLTVFDGVVDGERLYEDRWDHKDPVFFWSGAVVFFVFGAHGPAILDAALLLVIGVCGHRLALDRGCPPLAAALIAVGLMGFVTNPAFHATGLTEPPAVALLLAAYVLVGRGLVTPAFVLAGLIVPMKLGFALLAIPVVIAGLRSGWVPLARQAAALASPTIVTVAVLAARGELVGWIDSIQFNRRYAQEGPPWFGARSEGIPGHVERLYSVISESPSLLVALALLVLGSLSIWRLRAPGDGASGLVPAAFWFVVTMALTFLTAHMLRAAVPLLALAGISLYRVLGSRFSAASALLALALLMGVASGPHPSDLDAIPTIGDRWDGVDTRSADAVQAVIDRHSAEGTVALAVSIGPPRDAFIPFLDDRVKLACPTHHLLPWFESRFADHEECIRSMADIVIVGHLDFRETAPMVDYRDRVDDILRADFRRLETVERLDASRLVVWVRSASSSDTTLG